MALTQLLGAAVDLVEDNVDHFPIRTQKKRVYDSTGLIQLEVIRKGLDTAVTLILTVKQSGKLTMIGLYDYNGTTASPSAVNTRL